MRNTQYLILVCGLLTAACGLMCGCEQVDKDSINKILQEDPAFKEQLARKQEIDQRIGAYFSQLQETKTAAYSKIHAIQEDFNKQKMDIDTSITALKKELDPERFKIRRDIEAMTGVISSKRGVLKNLDNTKRNLLGLINQQKAVKATEAEMTKWHERLASLDKEIEPLKGEIAGLEEKMRVLRMKLIALRQ